MWWLPDSCTEVVQRAQTAYNLKQYERAASDFEAALSHCTAKEPVYLALGQAQLMGRQFAEAVQSFSKIPNNPMARKMSADALYLQGKDTEAEEMLKSALRLDPKHEPSLYALGRMYYQSSRYPEAVEQFQKVLALDTKSYRAHDNLGLVYDAMQQDSLALKHFFAALNLVMKDHPDYDWAHANLADFFLKRNQYEKAFQLASEAANRNPSSARNFFLTGKALAGLNKDELALKWLRQAVALDPEYASAHYALGQALRRTGHAEEAAKHFEIFKKVNTNARAKR